MNTAWTFLNGQFIKEDQATLHINDLAIQRGYGVFDFFRTINNIPLYLDEHLTRFYYSAQKMRLTINLLPNEIKDIILMMIQKNNIPYSGVRLTLTGGYSPDGYTIAPPNFFITQRPLQPSSQKSIKLILHDYQRELPDAKSINYMMGIWLEPFIKERGADDVLYFKDGLIRECPRANFFIVTKQNVVVTPARRILKGITRKRVLELAKNHFAAEERDITIRDLQQAREAFITSTTKQILPVTQVNDLEINSAKENSLTFQLSQLLQEAQDNYLSQRKIV